MPVVRPDFSHETTLVERGFALVAGVDEAGRGPLAGPVVAGAVLFADEASARAIDGLTDSKQLTPRQREIAFEAIIQSALSWATCVVEADEIDRINILQAALKAMAGAVAKLDPPPDAVLVDGNHLPTAHFDTEKAPHLVPLVKGDSRSLSVAAASIVAKVTRDRLMLAYDPIYPEYGFARHKGYPSPEHRRAIARHGVCPIHRRTFKGVREFCDDSEGGAR